jgi:hypothetical protein
MRVEVDMAVNEHEELRSALQEIRRLRQDKHDLEIRLAAEQGEVVHLQQTLEAHRKIERACKLWRKWYLDRDDGGSACDFNMALAGHGPGGVEA